jgi:hypothetical protein
MPASIPHRSDAAVYADRVPDAPKNPPLVPATIRLDPDKLDAVDQLAAEEQRQRSAMGRILMREALEARGKLPAAKRARKGR